MNILDIIGRQNELFEDDITANAETITSAVTQGSFLIIGGAGSIGQAVTTEIFKRQPKNLHVIDINENNLVELVRTIRSTIGYNSTDFRTYAIDCGSSEFDALVKHTGPYDYILNLSALKHVRSEKDPYTLMRMIRVNILNTIKIAGIAKAMKAKKYFCVSTDKAANPVNLMGASKRIMELFLMRESTSLNISTARFANVAFSDGSLLHGFNQRFAKKQPITAPNDVKRYFVTPKEAGELCLVSCLMADNRDIVFPNANEQLRLTKLTDIADKFLLNHGFQPHQCKTEDEARSNFQELYSNRKWPVYYFKSDTTGEKSFEEFFTEDEEIDYSKFQNIGIIKNELQFNDYDLNKFTDSITHLLENQSWTKKNLVDLFQKLIPDLRHEETGKYLDGKM